MAPYVQPKRPLVQASRRRRQVARGHQPPGRVEESLAGLGERNTVDIPGQQWDAELRLEPGDALGQRLLADGQRGGGPAEMPLVNHRDEGPYPA